MAGAVVAVLAVLSSCGGTTTTTISNSSAPASGAVSVVVTAPTGGSVIAANSVTVRGTVDPPDATVQIQGKPAAVGNGVFTGEADLHGGKTTIDVIGSAPGETPGSTSVTVVEQSTSSQPHKSKSGPRSGGSSGAPAAPPSGQTSCSGDLSAGPDTSCAFAEEVQDAYRSSGGAEVVEAYSPVTKKLYVMTCVGAARVECTGGIGASVFFSR